MDFSRVELSEDDQAFLDESRKFLKAHVTDDVLLLAQAAVGKVKRFPDHRDAETVRGFVLEDACRYFEFRAVAFDESEARVRIECAVV